MEIEKSALKIYHEANQIIRKVYNKYIIVKLDDNTYTMIYPNGEALKDARIFKASHFTGNHTYPFTDIFENICIDASAFNTALKAKYLRMDRTDKHLIMGIEDKKEQIIIGDILTDEAISNQLQYVLSKTPELIPCSGDRELNSFTLSDDIIDSLEGYNAPTINLGKLKLVPTIKLIPMTKKLSHVVITVIEQPDEHGIYSIAIISSNTNNTFSFTSYHKVLNF